MSSSASPGAFRAIARLCLLVVSMALLGVATTKAEAGDLPPLPPTLAATSEHEGKPVVRVVVEVEGQLWTKAPPVDQPVVGKPLALEAARKELSRLLFGGGFSAGTLSLEAKEAGVEVTYRLVPSRAVRKVVTSGDVLGEEDTLRAAGLLDVRQVTEASLRAATQKLVALYARRGFPSAVVSVTAVEVEPLFVEVRVVIESGAPVRVGARVFAGVPAWDPKATALAADYEVQIGDRADDDALEAADKHLGAALRVAGFHQAVVTHATVVGADGKATVTVQVVPGSKILVAYEGATVFDAGGLDAVLDLAHETDRSPARLAEKLVAAYVRRGRLDAKVEPLLLGKLGDPTRTLRFRIREGPIVTVERRVYPCLAGALDAKRLDAEIDAFLEQELSIGNFVLPSSPVVDGALGKQDVGVASGARPEPEAPPPARTFVPDVYDKAVEHLRKLYWSEGYLAVEIGEVAPARAACSPTSSGPTGCVALPVPPPDEKKLCRFDDSHLPLPIPAADKKATCVPDPLGLRTCARSVTVVVPINPGPRSYLWDVKVEGPKAFAPGVVFHDSGAEGTLELGRPLSLRAVDVARTQIEAFYRDEGYAYATVKVAFEHSPDRSRTRVRFLVNEGELTLVDAIEISGAHHTSEALIRARLLVRPGDPLKARLVQASIERVYALGAFANVSAHLVNPTLPAKRKTLVVVVEERNRLTVLPAAGFHLGDGWIGGGDVTLSNLFSYAVAAEFVGRVSWQPFFGCDEGAPCTLYDPVLLDRWPKLPFGRRLARRIVGAISAPHNPWLGPVQTTLALVESNDLRRDFVLHRMSSVLTFAFRPLDWLQVVLSGSVERNDVLAFGQENVETLVSKNPSLASVLNIPNGLTGVVASNLSVVVDFRDNKLAATKNGYLAVHAEVVKSFLSPEGQARQQFLHLRGATGVYFQAARLPGKPVLALELRGGVNLGFGSCRGADPAVCDTYPDRLFYLGGPESVRGFFPGQMLPQDSIDLLREDPDALLGARPCNEIAGGLAQRPVVAAPGFADAPCGQALASSARRGGNVYVNPRVELRVAAFEWGSLVAFLDAANTWRALANFQPLRLRYTVGLGVSLDTPIGPMALDVGVNLSRHPDFGEPAWVPSFSIGRF